MTNPKLSLLIAIILILAAAAIAFLYSTFFKSQTEIYSMYPSDQVMWDKIFSEGENAYEFESKPFGVIIPHHMVPQYELAKFYKGMSEVANPSTIVVVGPNHYESGTANIQTCFDCIYKTITGDLEINKKMTQKLIDSKLASRLDSSFENEHAIFSHAPYIRKYFPETKIVPIILQWEMPQEEVIKLSDWLNDELPPDAIVIASVDFSHYLRKSAANFHDETSFTTISNFDLPNVYDLELDSPSSIYLILDLMKKRGYQEIERLAHTNNEDFLSIKQEESTSHQFIAFFEGEMTAKKGVSILSFGKIMKNNSLFLVKDWNWDRNYNPNTDTTVLKMLGDIKGKEDRFLTGADFNVFDMTDGACELQEQNGLKISFCKFSEMNDYEENPMTTISLQAENADLVYLLYEFAGTEITAAQKTLAQDFISAGADIIVGRGFKEIYPMENYEGGLIFYSLGDFVVDNSLINQLSQNSSGMVVGINVSPEFYEIYGFPVDVVNGMPRLKSFSEADDSFANFASLVRGVATEIEVKENYLKIQR